MSEQDNNLYENQTPPDDGFKPDYSYNWNGTEHDNNKRGRTGGIIATAVILLLLVCGMFVGGYFVARKLVLPYFLSNDTDEAVSETDISENGETPSGNKPSQKPGAEGQGNKKPAGNFEQPEFDYSDGDTNLATDLTAIYETCSPSCCTIRVSVGGRLYSIGSGFVIDDENGYVATNHHVIDDGEKIEVVFYNGDTYTAEIVGSNAVTDLAVLKIEAEGLKAVTFGNSDNVCVGEDVVAIGTPYDESLAGTMTCGIISGIARNIDITNDSGKVIKTMTLLQTDCSINPGNSGGPLIDMAGNVIGITSLKLVDEQFEGIGFAIPITAAADIFEKLIAGESIGDNELANAAPQIGVTVYELEAGLQAFYMDPSCEYPDGGALVADISRSSSAYIAGLSVYDIIIDFDGTEINNLDDLTVALSGYKAGDTVTITVFRFNRSLTSGEEISITFVLDAAE